ncbi:unnamed protein product [Prorocentrum cordatum]|uniref:Uncharacterized protein n=1 Tax=Prorocentrum cordatum TaxID=2364126 RepID=A0ABN9Y8N9_9DINO|nr:unnamed protein product [Polarella glacialis]
MSVGGAWLRRITEATRASSSVARGRPAGGGGGRGRVREDPRTGGPGDGLPGSSGGAPGCLPALTGVRKQLSRRSAARSPCARAPGRPGDGDAKCVMALVPEEGKEEAAAGQEGERARPGSGNRRRGARSNRARSIPARVRCWAKSSSEVLRTGEVFFC